MAKDTSSIRTRFQESLELLNQEWSRFNVEFRRKKIVHKSFIGSVPPATIDVLIARKQSSAVLAESESSNVWRAAYIQSDSRNVFSWNAEASCLASESMVFRTGRMRILI